MWRGGIDGIEMFKGSGLNLLIKVLFLKVKLEEERTWFNLTEYLGMMICQFFFN